MCPHAQVLCGSDFRVHNMQDQVEIARVPDSTPALRDGAPGAVCTNSIDGYKPASETSSKKTTGA